MSSFEKVITDTLDILSLHSLKTIKRYNGFCLRKWNWWDASCISLPINVIGKT